MDQKEIDSLRHDVLEYADRRGGKIYSPICHPEFSDIPWQHGPERFEIIKPFIDSNAQTALDIGSHWGYFAHRLEELGLKVVAAENMKEYLKFLYRFRDLYDDEFEVWPDSIFDMGNEIRFDVVLGLNIFHHFLKKESDFLKFQDLLQRLNCKQLFVQFHDPKEGQMDGAYRNFNAEEFCDFLINHSRLSDAQRIGGTGKRSIYLLQ